MKTWALCAFVAFIASTVPTGAEEEHGTIAVVRYSLSRLMIAADSRTNLGTRSNTTTNDGACKVASLGEHAAFVASGLVGYDNNGPRDLLDTWRATDEARRVYAHLLKRDSEWQDDRLDEFAMAWGNLVRSRVAALAHFNPLAVRSSVVNGLLTTALVATGRGKRIRAVVVQIGIDSDGRIALLPLRRIEPEVCPPCALGRGEIVTEFLGLTSERARVEAARFARETRTLAEDERERRRVLRLVQLTINLLPDRNEVGGPIDALELRASGGVHWIQRKLGCPE
jgi:hypothetical protein